MLQNIIHFSNLVSPFIASFGILYVSIGWILIYFKKETLANKYFTTDGDALFCSVFFWLVAVVMLVAQAIVDVPSKELSPLGFTFIFGGSILGIVFVLVAIVQALIKYRKSITPQ